MFKRHQLTLLITIFLLSVCCTKPVIAANIASDEAAAYAGFIQNMVSLSQINTKGSFCILGHDAVARSLSQSKKNKAIDQESADPYRKCRAVYLSVENVTNLKMQLGDLTKKKILTIGTFEGFIENGGMIQVEMGRRNFELTIDVNALYNAGIKLDTLSTNLIIN